MSVTSMDMDEHDEIMSWISHLPHLVASSLINTIISRVPEMSRYCGNGLRDTTRIAAGNPQMWMQILLGNKENLKRGIDDLIESLEGFKEALLDGDQVNLLNILQSAKDSRDSLDEY